ncbi:MAG: hypothetical protein AB1651_10170 [Pseudomonadota bacterium]
MQINFMTAIARSMGALVLLAAAWQPLAHAQAPDPSTSPALCGASDTQEAGIQGDVNSGTVNCGLTLLVSVPGGGSVQGSGHYASESMRAKTTVDRAVLLSGRAVYDIRNCEDMVKKGEILRRKSPTSTNDGAGHVHSGVLDYGAARGIMLASGSEAVHVLVMPVRLRGRRLLGRRHLGTQALQLVVECGLIGQQQNY